MFFFLIYLNFKACLVSPFYRGFTLIESHLNEVTQLIMFTIRYTVTKGKDGGRGSFFTNLITEKILVHIQKRLGGVMYDFLKCTKKTDGESVDIKSMFRANKFFSMEAFYHLGSEYDGTNNIVKVKDYDVNKNSENIYEWHLDILDPFFTSQPRMNLLDIEWSYEVFNKQSLIKNAFVRRNDGSFRFAQHAPSRIKKLITDVIHPDRRTCYLIIAMGTALGFNMDEENKAVNDIIGPRLQAYMRFYIGTILFQYYRRVDDYCVDRVNILKFLEERRVFFRGHNNISFYTKKEAERNPNNDEDGKKEGNAFYHFL